ncbi:CpsD/CapB family tyrosine-protein kinase [Petroclostridium sp. X23]|uniref:CpsD/CapB family tyrosine-protein kinase n=1 Tax=Petroclostridium sp. X23 TaxID=3045146 RepID=UPI0024AD350E|nr:CpsD/CapB family tyrosine-protein kinase [Petroclostridium sp. X23]WHH57520.1 CpsD/CapB family tyrosine-protein kinase [Petroclostridium sp. X23]
MQEQRPSLITHNNPKSPISEAYRVLRTNIQFSGVDKPLKIMVVTSAGPGEGKSTTIANLAITFAQSGSKVLLIDGDLRKPKVHKTFNTHNQTGLTNVLAQHADYKQYVKQCDIDNLDILTSGPIPPNPSELLSSNSMKKLLERFREDYEIVLIDAPPVGTVTDAAILSTIVDGTILVAASGQVEIEAAQRAKQLLEKVNANIIGVVLNKLSKNEQGNYYYYYYYYYGEDDGNDKKKRKKPKEPKDKE